MFFCRFYGCFVWFSGRTLDYNAFIHLFFPVLFPLNSLTLMLFADITFFLVVMRSFNLTIASKYPHINVLNHSQHIFDVVPLPFTCISFTCRNVKNLFVKFLCASVKYLSSRLVHIGDLHAYVLCVCWLGYCISGTLFGGSFRVVNTLNRNITN